MRYVSGIEIDHLYVLVFLWIRKAARAEKECSAEKLPEVAT